MVSFRRGVVLLHKFMVQPVSIAIILDRNTEWLLGRAERAHKEGKMGGK